MNKYFEIGKIVGTHGLKGTLKVYPTTEYPERFELLKNIIINNSVNNNSDEYKNEVFNIQKIAYHKKIVLVTLKEINDINIAEKYKNATIIIPEEYAIPLEENEYYKRDLYDIKVYTDNDEFLGIISEIYETGANDVYSIIKEGEKELLIPAIKECILDVNISEKKMIVKLLDGLK